MNQKDNTYYYAYQILRQSMNNEDPVQALGSSLQITKDFVECDDIILYKLDEDSQYKKIMDQSDMDYNLKYIETILNNIKVIMSDKKRIQLNVKIENHPIQLIFQPIFSKQYHYVLAMTNIKKEDINDEVLDVTKDSFQTLLENMELIYELKIRGNKDSLTNIDNRHPFSEKLKEITSSKSKYTFVIFDLFQLKTINDKFGHDVGDEYIRKTASVLKKYFPKYQLETNEMGLKKKRKTGSCIYRIGGDEFALISKTEDAKIVELKIDLLKDEISTMNLGVLEPVTLGINYGIVSRDNYETGEQLYQLADKELRKDKQNVYEKLGIERRGR